MNQLPPQAQQLLAQAHRQLSAGDPASAAVTVQPLAQRWPEHPALLGLWGSALAAMGRLESARNTLKKAITSGHADPLVYHTLAVVLRRQGLPDDAARLLENAVQARPNDPLIHKSRSDLVRDAGRQADALALLEGAPDAVRAHFVVSLGRAQLLLDMGRAHESIEAAQSVAADTGLPALVRAHALRVVALAHDALDEPDQALAAARCAAELIPIPFDSAAHSEAVDRLIGAWSADALGSLPRSALRSPAPVIIVGLPRSGVAQLDRLLSAHPDIRTLGDSSAIHNLVRQLQPEAIGPLPVLTELFGLVPDRINAAGLAYQEFVKGMAPQAERVISASPLNALHLGLISLVCPGASIVCCTRDPRETTLACFLENHPSPLPFAQSPESIAAFVHDHERLMRHWRTVIDAPFVEVEHDRLLAEPEAVAREVCQAIGVEFKPSCLRALEDRTHFQARPPRARRYESRVPALGSPAG